MLFKAKRYATLPFEWKNQRMVPSKKGIKVMGMETVRRDSTPLVAAGTATILELLLERSSTSAADRVRRVVEYVRRTMIMPLRANLLSFRWITQSKQLRMSPAAYRQGGRSAPIHAEVADALEREHGVGSPLVPRTGSRVPYIVVEPRTAAERKRKSLCGRDPLSAWRAREQPNVAHYVDTEILNSVTRLLEPIVCAQMMMLTERARLKYTRSAIVSMMGSTLPGAVRVESMTPTPSRGGITRRRRCACTRPLPDDADARRLVCDECAERTDGERARIANERTELWHRCITCKRDAGLDVIDRPLTDIEDLETSIDCSRSECATYFDRLAADRQWHAYGGPTTAGPSCSSAAATTTSDESVAAAAASDESVAAKRARCE